MEWYLETDMLIAYLVVGVSTILLLLRNRYEYNPKLRDMEDPHIMDAIDNFGRMMSNIYSLPPVKIVIEDLSNESAVYVDGPIEACFMPKDKNGSRIIIDLERLKSDGWDLSTLCSVVIHEYTHYYDCSLFDDYKDWLKDYESNPWHYELRSKQSEKDYTKTLMKEYCAPTEQTNSL
jgi:hypothetical protein